MALAEQQGPSDNAMALVFADMQLFSTHSRSLNHRGPRPIGLTIGNSGHRFVEADVQAFVNATATPIARDTTAAGLMRPQGRTLSEQPSDSGPQNTMNTPISAGGLLSRGDTSRLRYKPAATPPVTMPSPSNMAGSSRIATSLASYEASTVPSPSVTVIPSANQSTPKPIPIPISMAPPSSTESGQGAVHARVLVGIIIVVLLMWIFLPRLSLFS